MSTRILLITLFLILGKHLLSSQTLTGYDGELEYLYNQTYTVQPIPPNDTSISPTPTGAEWGVPMLFILDANEGDRFQVSLRIMADPDNCIPFTPTSFPPNGLRWVEKDIRFNPDSINYITVDTSNKATFHLGFTISIPSYERYLQAPLIVCSMVNTVTGDVITASASVFLYNPGFPIPDTWCKMENLSRGYSYSFTPDSAAPVISPRINGQEEVLFSNFQILGDIGDSMYIKFHLPTSLASDIEDGTGIPCRFLPHSVRVEETGELFNPNERFLFRITKQCFTSFDLGITLDIPANMPAGTYTGHALVEITTIGNLKTGESARAVSSSAVMFYASIIDLEIPESFSLSQNYPNPFNSGTKIRFGLPEPVNVNLVIYDVLGREVATLVDEFRYAGIHTIDWQAEGLSTGLYFYKLTAGDYTEVKKLTIIR